MSLVRVAGMDQKRADYFDVKGHGCERRPLKRFKMRGA